MQKRSHDDSRNTAEWRHYDESLREQSDVLSWSQHTGLRWTIVVLLLVAIVAMATWGSVAMVHLIDRLAKP